jgi:Putative peptidoglycan binding domain/LysM domain
VPLQHRIESGDSVSGLAKRYGFLPQTLWDAPENGELRSRREDMNTLMPGDVLVIPDKRVDPIPLATGRSHRFRIKGALAILRMQVYDFGEPRAGEDFVLTVGSHVVEGTTDGDGVLEAQVPVLATSGHLVIGEDQFVVEILFGHLDPASELSGIQQRLLNLGYTCHDSPGELGASTRRALGEFQSSQGLDVSGELDDDTRGRIVELHDAKADSISSEPS